MLNWFLENTIDISKITKLVILILFSVLYFFSPFFYKTPKLISQNIFLEPNCQIGSLKLRPTSQKTFQKHFWHEKTHRFVSSSRNCVMKIETKLKNLWTNCMHIKIMHGKQKKRSITIIEELHAEGKLAFEGIDLEPFFFEVSEEFFEL